MKTLFISLAVLFTVVISSCDSKYDDLISTVETIDLSQLDDSQIEYIDELKSDFYNAVKSKDYEAAISCIKRIKCEVKEMTSVND